MERAQIDVNVSIECIVNASSVIYMACTRRNVKSCDKNLCLLLSLI